MPSIPNCNTSCAGELRKGLRSSCANAMAGSLRCLVTLEGHRQTEFCSSVLEVALSAEATDEARGLVSADINSPPGSEPWCIERTMRSEFSGPFLGSLDGKRQSFYFEWKAPIFSWRAVPKTPKASHRDGVGLTGGRSRGARAADHPPGLRLLRGGRAAVRRPLEHGLSRIFIDTLCP